MEVSPRPVSMCHRGLYHVSPRPVSMCHQGLYQDVTSSSVVARDCIGMSLEPVLS